MNMTLALRDDSGMPAPAPLVWCAWPVTYLYTQSYRVLFCVVMLPLCLQVGGLRPMAASAGYAMVFLSSVLVTGALLGILTNTEHDGDVFALSLTLQHATYALMMCLLATSLRRQSKEADLRPFYAGACMVVFAARMVMQYYSLGGGALDLADSTLVSMSCDAAGACVNPCKGMSVKSRPYRSSTEPLLPIIWSMDGGSQISRLGAANEWIVNASTVESITYQGLIRLVRLSYLLVGPAYSCVRALSEASPRETRNRIFRQLQQDWHPRDEDEFWVTRAFLRFMISSRYHWNVLVVVSMEARVCQQLVKLGLWMRKHYFRFLTREDPIELNDLIVLRQDSSPQRRVLAKYFAAAVYFCLLATYLIFPAFFIYVTVKTELAVNGWLPQEQSFDNSGQWIAWVGVGAAAVGYTIWHLFFEKPQPPMISIFDEPPPAEKEKSDRKKIFMADFGVEDEDAEKIALLEQNIENNDLSWPRYIMARTLLEWYDWKYWWSNPTKASAEHKPEKDDNPGRNETWRSGVGRSEAEEEETQKLLYEQDRSRRRRL